MPMCHGRTILVTSRSIYTLEYWMVISPVGYSHHEWMRKGSPVGGTRSFPSFLVANDASTIREAWGLRFLAVAGGRFSRRRHKVNVCWKDLLDVFKEHDPQHERISAVQHFSPPPQKKKSHYQVTMMSVMIGGLCLLCLWQKPKMK